MNKMNWIVFCILSLFLCFSTSAVADLILAEGKATGQWYNPQRNGEGFFVEIINIGDDVLVSIAMFTYDDTGKQMWLTGVANLGVSDVNAQIPVNRFDGPVWGPDYDMDDLNIIPFGSVTVRFPTCDTALFSIVTDVGFPGGNYSLVRLTDIEGIECNDPPPMHTLTPGRWEGTGVCFNVAADGLSITEIGSTCDQGNAFDSNLNGLNNDLNECDVEADCEGVWKIEDGTFSCVTELGTLVVGTFESSTSASGLAFEGESGVGDFCSAGWSASPN